MDMAPTTAFSGRNISEDSLAMSTAILATPYAVFQSISLPRTVVPSLDASRGSRDGEPIERAIAVDEATSDSDILLDVNLFTSAGDGGAVAGNLGLRKLGIVMRADRKTDLMVIAMSTMIGSTKTVTDNVATAPVITRCRTEVKLELELFCIPHSISGVYPSVEGATINQSTSALS